MKRIAIIAIVAALFASTAAIAFADDAEVEAAEGETEELNDTQYAKAEMFAKYFADSLVGEGELGDEPDEEAALDEIIALRTGEPAVGWGAMFKLLQLAEANGVSLHAMLEEIGDEGWAFGKRFKELGDDAAEPREDAAKNYGQLKKQNREAKGNQGNKP